MKIRFIVNFAVFMLPSQSHTSDTSTGVVWYLEKKKKSSDVKADQI